MRRALCHMVGRSAAGRRLPSLPHTATITYCAAANAGWRSMRSVRREMKRRRALKWDHRFSPDVIRHAVWPRLRFKLSYRDVEDLLAERGFDIRYETLRRWTASCGVPTPANSAAAASGRRSLARRRDGGAIEASNCTRAYRHAADAHAAEKDRCRARGFIDDKRRSCAPLLEISACAWIGQSRSKEHVLQIVQARRTAA